MDADFAESYEALRPASYRIPAKLKNLRIVCHDAVEVLKLAIPNEAFDEVLIFFPDPWHKARHNRAPSPRREMRHRRYSLAE